MLQVGHTFRRNYIRTRQQDHSICWDKEESWKYYQNYSTSWVSFSLWWIFVWNQWYNATGWQKISSLISRMYIGFIRNNRLVECLCLLIDTLTWSLHPSWNYAVIIMLVMNFIFSIDEWNKRVSKKMREQKS